MHSIANAERNGSGEAMSEPAGITLSRIEKRFGPLAVLRDVSLDIRPGEFLTLVGPSGCGKSTLLRIIAGLEVQTIGTVAIGGRPADALGPDRRDIAMVFQSYALYPHMTVAENIATPMRLRRLSGWQRWPLIGRFGRARAIGTEINREVAAAAELLGIGALLDRKPGQLSGGQRQRVALGRALVRQPRVFLMDEPLSNLDSKLRVHMRAEIARLHRRLGATFVYVTHDQTEAMTMSDRIAVMLDGQVRQIDTPTAIYREPADYQVAAFMAQPQLNAISVTGAGPGAVEACGTRILVGGLVPAGTRAVLTFRPEECVLLDGSAPQGLAGTISHVERLGAEGYAHLAVDGVAELIVARLDAERLGRVERGQAVRFLPDPERAFCFDDRGRRLTATERKAGLQ
ncbi:multiple sugar transport system ATP-binding protein [Inquilinus ginsengisoli]|uniref:ABC transporter ATP-binding protein n=1 Tax=Inquilinus ginsengisoli TaxID=363840 RepID=UPI003D1D58CC